MSERASNAPEPVEVATIEPPDGGGPNAANLFGIPRLLGSALADLRTIAEGMAVLPRLAEILGSIDSQVEQLNAEVTRMREGVDSMGGDVAGVKEGIARLEPHLEDVRRATRPLERIAQRARRITSAGPEQ